MVSGERSGGGIISPVIEGGEMAKGSARTKKKLFKTNSKKRAIANKKYKDTVFRKLSDLYMPEESGNNGR